MSKICVLVLCLAAVTGCAKEKAVVRQNQPSHKSIRSAPRSGQGVYAEISTAKVKDKIDQGVDIVIIDVRSEKEFKSGHLKNAVHIPISQLMSRLNDLDPNKETIVYCHSGIRSRTGGNILVSKGFRKVRNMAAGISGWKHEIVK